MQRGQQWVGCQMPCSWEKISHPPSELKGPLVNVWCAFDVALVAFGARQPKRIRVAQASQGGRWRGQHARAGGDERGILVSICPHLGESLGFSVETTQTLNAEILDTPMFPSFEIVKASRVDMQC